MEELHFVVGEGFWRELGGGVRLSLGTREIISVAAREVSVTKGCLVKIGGRHSSFQQAGNIACFCSECRKKKAVQVADFEAACETYCLERCMHTNGLQSAVRHMRCESCGSYACAGGIRKVAAGGVCDTAV